MKRHNLEPAFGVRVVALVALAIVPVVWATSASATSLKVKLACSSDYYAHCSKFPSDSPEVRQCMRRMGDKLSSRCIQALISAGEVSQAEVSRRAAQLNR